MTQGCFLRTKYVIEYVFLIDALSEWSDNVITTIGESAIPVSELQVHDEYYIIKMV